MAHTTRIGGSCLHNGHPRMIQRLLALGCGE
jgi:hypothetical protein